MHDNAMGRAEFLKYVVGKTTSTATEFMEVLAEPLHQVEGIIKQTIYKRILPIDQYFNEPKLLTSSQPPLYIVGEINKNLIAFSAVCEKDGLLLSYLPQESAFYCSLCGIKHSLVKADEYMVADLPSFSLTVEDGFICLIKNG